MQQHEAFKIQLETELDNVTTGLKEVAVQSPDTGDWVAIPVAKDIGNADENVGADAVEEWNERRALMAQLEIRYRNITRALKKMEDGSFGICEISGEPIEAARLEANPAARTNMANIDREKELTI